MQAPRRLQLRRGNTAATSTYVGAPGELIVNTDTNTLYLHDGLTVGGIATTINTASITTNISALESNVLILQGNITTLTSNAAVQAGILATLLANAGAQSGDLATLTANAANQSGSLADLIANAAVQAGLIANSTGTYSNANVKTYLSSFDGNVLPSANVTYSLGSATRQWKDLFVSNNTIYIGGIPLSIDAGGNLLVNGNTVQAGADSTGNIVFNGTSIALDAGKSSAASTVLEMSPNPEGWAYLQLPNNFSANVSDTRLHNDAGNVEISSGDFSHGGAGYNWTFSRDGNLILPRNSRIAEVPSPVYGNYALSLSGTGAVSPDQQLLIYPTSVDANHLHLTTGNLYNTELFFGNDDLYVKLSNVGDVVVNTNDNQGNTAQWTFGTDGTTIFPNQAIDGGTAPIELKSRSWSQLTYNNADMNQEPNKNHSTTFYVEGGDALLEIFRWDSGNVLQHRQWTFDSTGNLTLPQTDMMASPQPSSYPGITYTDGSTQITAFSNAAVSTYLSSHTNQTFGGNVTIQGNLFVNGNVTTISTNSYTVTDNIISIADGNPADTLDVGFTAHRTVNSILQHTGLIRDASAGNWKLFSNVITSPGNTADFTNAIYDDLQVGNISSPTINTITANLGAVAGSLATLTANAGAQSGSLATITANLGAVAGSLATLTSNAAAQAGDIATLYANAGAQSGSLATITANLGSVAGSLATLTSNAAVQAGLIANISSGTTYSNTNVAAYLTTANITTTGNITAANFSGNISITGNVTGTSPNVTLQAGSYNSVFNNQGNVILPNLAVTGNTVTGGYFLGNGALLTGIVASAGTTYSNANVASYLPTYSGNLSAGGYFGLAGADGTTVVDFQTGAATNQIITLGSNYTFSIKAGAAASNRGSLVLESGQNTRVRVNGSSSNVQITAGNGVQTSTWLFSNSGVLTFPDSTTMSTSYGNTQVAAYLPTYTGNITAANVTATGNVTAAYIITSGGYGNITQVDTITANNGVFSGNITGNTAGFTIGYRDIPQVAAGNVTLALTDAGKHYYSTAAYITTLTIPTNANVGFPIGTAITIVNQGTGNITVANAATVTMYLASNSTASTNRTVTSYGMATLLKVATNTWFIDGSGVV